MNKLKKRILIVDDEEDITWSVAKGVSKDNPGVDVICANNGNDALDILSNSRIDLLLTDIRMPGLNGKQWFEQIRLQRPDVRILVMTAYGSRDVHEWLKEFGRISYIEKPFEIAELRERIGSLLGRNVKIQKAKK